MKIFSFQIENYKKGAFWLVIGLSILFFMVQRFKSTLYEGVIQLTSCSAYPLIKLNKLVIEPLDSLLIHQKRVQELQCAYDVLKKEHVALQSKLIQQQSLLWYVDDTDLLRTFCNRYDLKTQRIVQIMVRHFSHQAHYFLVDQGSNSGISVDMVAFAEGCLVGKVTEVYPWYSKIVLITDQSCKIASLCGGTGAAGIHQGMNADQTMVSYVSHLACVVDGDLVISSGQGLVFPYGFGLGTVSLSAIEGPYRAIQVKPFLDFSTLRYCTLAAKAEIVMLSDEIKK